MQSADGRAASHQPAGSVGAEHLERLRSLVVALIRLGEQRGCVRLLSPEFAVWLAERRFVVQDVLDAAELAEGFPGRARICMFGSTDDPFLQITAPTAPRSRAVPSAPSIAMGCETPISSPCCSGCRSET